MPQFDTANFLPQLVWLAFFFAILYFGVVRMTLPRVDRVLDQRDSMIEGDLTAAESAKRDADALQQEFEQGLLDAQMRARTQLDEARDAAAKQVEKRLAEAAAVIADKQAAAEARLSEARERALAEVSAVAEQAAGDIVERLIGTRPAAEQTRAALAQAKAV